MAPLSNWPLTGLPLTERMLFLLFSFLCQILQLVLVSWFKREGVGLVDEYVRTGNGTGA